jgi:hypothetical protein
MEVARQFASKVLNAFTHVREQLHNIPTSYETRGASDVRRTASSATRTKRRVRAAQQYMEWRKEGRVKEVLGLVSENIVLESSRDGRVSGRSKFEEYLRNVKPTGTWAPATWNSEKSRPEICGTVKILMVKCARFFLQATNPFERNVLSFTDLCSCNSFPVHQTMCWSAVAVSML